jgi:hypothetical protein
MKLPVIAALALALLVGPSSASAAVRQVSGYIRFQDYRDFNNTVAYPGLTGARNLPLAVSVGATTISPAGLTTDSNGYFSFSADLPASGTLHLVATGSNYAMQFTGTAPTWVLDKAIAGTTEPIDLSRTVSKADGAIKLNILNAVAVSRAYGEARADDPNDSIPSNAARVFVNHPDSGTDLARYNDMTNTIRLPGPVAAGCSDPVCKCGTYGASACEWSAGWEDVTVSHEYAHHLQYTLSGQPMPMNTAGDACWGYLQQQAWHEGFPTWFAIVATGNMNPFFTGFVFDADDPDCNSYLPNYPSPGPQLPNAAHARYEDIWATLHDIDDGTPDEYMKGYWAAAGGGTVADLIVRIFDNELDIGSAPTIHSFHDAFVARNPYPKAHRDLDHIMVKNRTMFSPTPHSLPDFAVGSLSVSPSSPTMNGTATLTMQFGSVNGVTYPGATLSSVILVGGTIVSVPELDAGMVYGTVTRTISLPQGMLGSRAVKVEVGSSSPWSPTQETSYGNNVATKTITIKPICGDGACSSGETCFSCVSDCGDCDEWEPSCFTAGTPITMADGSTKPIEQVRVGEEVLSWDEKSGALVAGAVEQTMVHPDSDRLVVVNDHLVTTAEHPFWVDGRWVEAAQLAVGDALLRAEVGHASPLLVDAMVTNLEARGGRATTYNFTVSRFHDYFAGGVLVHNKPPVDDP